MYRRTMILLEPSIHKDRSAGALTNYFSFPCLLSKSLGAGLKQDGRQARASGFVVKPHRHQRHRLNHSKPTLKAPAEQPRVASRHKNPRTLELCGCGNQCLQVLIGFTNRMTGESNGRCVRFDSPLRFGDHRSSLLNRIIEFASTVVPMDSLTKIIAGFEIARFRRADMIAERRLLNRCPPHTHKWFAHHETELRIQRQGTIIVSGLHQTNSRELPFHRMRDDGLHQLASHAAVLCAGVNRDGSHTGNGRSLIQTVAPDDFSVLFRHDAEERWLRKHGPECMPGKWEIVREIVPFGQRTKGFETDSAAHSCVGWSGAANRSEEHTSELQSR